MRVLIAGAAGFAGRYLARELVARGHEVFAGTRSGGTDEAPVGREGEGRPDLLPPVPLLPCDVTSRAQVEAAIAAARPDAVVLLAGLAMPAAANAEPERAFDVHALGAVHVLEAVARVTPSARAAIVTSSEVYGRFSPDELPLDEATPLRPESVYGASKAAADLAAAAIGAARGLDVVRLRPFNHTGPGQVRDFVCPDFAAQVAAIARGRRPARVEVGNVDVRRDVSDVRDVVRGYALALERGRAGEAYNLCSGREVAIRSILETLCELAGIQPEVATVPGRARAAEPPVVFGSFAKAAEELAWQPEIPLRRTLEDILALALAAEDEGARPSA
jgi:GDP-4-dehydro-6-deoxy-D-mannose reductase